MTQSGPLLSSMLVYAWLLVAFVVAGDTHANQAQGARRLLADARGSTFANSAFGNPNASTRFNRFDFELNLEGRKTAEIQQLGFPFTAIGQLSSGCSAFLVGPCHVMTVAHCVYEPKLSFWWPGTEFHAGRSGPSRWSPYGGVGRVKALVPEHWKNYGDYNHDYAMLILQQSIGNSIGWLEFGYDLDQEIVKVNVAGYPAYENDPSWVNGTMYYDACNAKFNFKNAQGRVAFHDCDTVGGSSGSPLWVYDSTTGRREVRAIHSHAARLPTGDLPTAIKFRDDVFTTVKQWKQQNECPQD